ncbi:MAG TPA: citrate (Si)-synthase [Bacteroidetes bacterium]|nr:citrate synthase [bacterium BMS3Bbin04]HDO65737.1 citrate (Si)-synthase [Bacteroidota bacterium]HEX04862.1 citrate (Si)-synthase [Bacteroidota bacterium]
MSILFERLQELVPQWRAERAEMIKKHGNMVLSECTVAQAYGGMRGVKGMICETSLVEPDKGLIIQGRPLLDIMDLWPEETFHLLLTGDIPDEAAKQDLMKELDKRSHVPEYVWDVLYAMPDDSHPMTMFNTAILCMQKESQFASNYAKGMTKADYWIPTFEDALTIMARLPGIAAGVYRIRYDKGDLIPWTPGLDWGANYGNMMGFADPTGSFSELMRLYLHFHCDHEGGNVSANTCHTVGSALSDPYYAVSAGLNGLAGPLHGLANQECLNWILETMDKFGGAPSEEQIREYAFETLRSGKVIPGYGHAVLRVTDPRFTGFNMFGKKHLPNDPVFQTVDRVFTVVPKVLEEFSAERVAAGKNPIANFWPNVDAGSGALLYHFGLKEFQYYTVLFSVSRAMGMLSQLVWNRAVGTAITRPKSIGSKFIREHASK